MLHFHFPQPLFSVILFCLGFKECFCLFDGDSDGMITESELALIMRSLGENVTHNEITAFMKKAGMFTGFSAGLNTR